MKISVANSRKSRYWTNKDIPIADLVSRLSSTVRTTETVEEYFKLSKGKRDDIKDIGGYVGGYLSKGRRKKGNVLCRSCLTLDMDYAEKDVWDKVISKLPWQIICHSTHKHTPDNPRLRLLVPLSREISEAEYPAVARMFANDVGIDMFDDSTYEANRLMYWPSTSSNGVFFFKTKGGAALDPDVCLARYDDWQDESTWPVSSRESAVVSHAAKEQADPLTKPGIVGAFCRAYPISVLIPEMLADIYAPTDDDSRYDYISADSSAGVVSYGDKFVYSHHATDPACGQLLNAFDLIRLHRYRDLDVNTPDGTAVTKLPSYKAMAEFASKDSKVKQLLLQEKQAAAKSEFSAAGGDWTKDLEYEPRSTVLKNSLHNLLLIVKNDPQLKSIVFNQQAESMEIIGKVPWKHPAKFWRDADDAQLICYIDSHYGTFSQRNYQVAVTKVADDRSYHPIREYLSALPEWDGIDRVDSLLIDYLGAEDNAYVRAVTRKTLCAAVRRVQQPGCKFDSMLVLNGPQGIGKSTLIAKLAGEWFSDSLNLSDTKDKTAAEKLQGYWILEIGELAGLRKAEVETLRSFLSRQNDIYRASFGKRATPHLRQCIFFGTTNAESGYLRDTTGNRRFWPVKTPGGGRLHSWDLAQNDIEQIWAETLVLVSKGETLFLDAGMTAIAKEEQREALETDEREGLVRDYLEMLLPENWDAMDLYQRRNFINGESEFGQPPEEGTQHRTQVCNMEIWCECFGKNRADLSGAESARLRAILVRLGWVRNPKKQRVPLYGPQWVYVPGDTEQP